MTDWGLPRAGHDCPNDADLREGMDDECDLPEPFRRLAYTVDVDPQHDCSEGVWAHSPHFCQHAVWREVKAAYREAVNVNAVVLTHEQQALFDTTPCTCDARHGTACAECRAMVATALNVLTGTKSDGTSGE